MQGNAGEEGVHAEIEAVPFGGAGSHPSPFRSHSIRSMHSRWRVQDVARRTFQSNQVGGLANRGVRYRQEKQSHPAGAPPA